MATPLGNMVVHLGLDNSGFQTKLRQTTGSIKSFKNDIKKMENQLKTSQAMSKYAITGREAFKAYGYQVKDLNRLITTHSQYQSKLVGDYNRVTAGTRELANDVQSLNKKYREAKGLYGENSEQAKIYAARLNETKAAMESGTKQAENLAKEYENSRQKLFQYRSELKEVIETQYSQHSLTARLGQGLTTIGNGLSTVSQKTRGMTVAIGTGFAVATKSALEFEDGMNTIRALIADDVPAQQMNSTMNQLSNAVKRYSTEYGISTGEVISGMQEMIRRGYDVNQTMAAMPHVLQASKASGEDFGTVMHATTAILEQFNLKAEDTQRVTDSLTYVANKTAADYSTLGTAMEYVGPMAATAGISMEQTAAAIGLLSQRGIEGEKAGTNLRAMLTTLVNPTDANAAAWERMGVSTDAFLAGSIDLADVLDLIKTNTEGMTDAQKAALISQAVGRTGQAGLNALVAQGGDALRNLTSATEGATGATKKMSDQMMESSKNQLKQMISELEVLGIEIGEDLLPYLKDIIEDGKGVVDWFKNLNPKTKEAAVKFALLTAAISPFSGALGLLFSAGGKTLSMIASLSGKVRALTAALKVGTGGAAMAGELATIGGAAVTTESSVGLLGGAIAALANPLGITVGALALAGGGLLAYEAYLDQGRARTEEWGTAVSNVEADQLSRFKAKVDETNESMYLFGTKAGDIDKVKESVQQLAEAVKELNNDHLNKDIDLANKLGLSDTVIEGLKSRANQVNDNIQTMSDEVIAIYEKHNNDTSQLTEQEKNIVLNNQNEMINKQLELMNFSAKERKALQTAINGDFESLNKTQQDKAIKNVQKMLDNENDAYKKKKGELKEILKQFGDDESKLSENEKNARKEVLDEIDKLEADHAAKKDAYTKQIADMQQKVFKQMGLDAKESALSMEAIGKVMEENGLTYEQAVEKMTKASSKAVDNNKMWAHSTADMTEEAKTANAAWNSLVWQDGKIKTNAQEVLQEALNAEDGWNGMKFIVQNAELDSNAVFAVGQALIATDQWNGLSPEDKQLIIDKAPAMGAINETAENMEAWKQIPDPIKNFLAQDDDFLNKTKTTKEVLSNWQDLPDAVKQFLGNNSNFITSADEAKRFLKSWDNMPEIVKSLLGDNNNFVASADEAKTLLNTWDNMPEKVKKMLGENKNFKEKADVAVDTLRNWNSLSPGVKDLIANNLASMPAEDAQRAVNALTGKTVDLDALNNTLPGVNDAVTSVGSFTGKTVSLLAMDNTTGTVVITQAKIDSVQQKRAAELKAKDNTAQVRSSVQSGINAIKQQYPVAIEAADHITSAVSGWMARLPKSHTINIVANVAGKVAKILGFENGTNYHRGGLAMVNDQKNANYKELVTLPGGVSFIPEGRNVILPLPRGSKVLKASKTKSLMQKYGIPKYADGIGYSADSPLFKAMDSVQQKVSVAPAPEVNVDNAEVLFVLKEIVNLLRDGNKKVPVANVYMDGELITRKVTEEQKRRSRIDSIMKGVPI
ncbi:MAG: phage tail tape measure protein [Streptococcus sp.]|uniref:phage tail tape measure protein n=1 Tax=Streptococcus sp. TaxID=1306 RepID=UPI0025863238|nr:phage tail tape measure protein [Streptococcus sp.]MCR5493022.1 phage tail tape measure protein [Streptococcus sp.]